MKFLKRVATVASLAIAGGGSGAGSNVTFEMSKGTTKHILNGHKVSRFFNQLSYLSKSAAEGILKTKSFFNPSWSEFQITNVVNQVANQAIQKGILNCTYESIINGKR